MKTLVILAVSLMSALELVGATASSRIHGRVVDPDGKAVCFANIILMGADSTFIAGCTADGQGMFDLQCEVSDDMLLKVSAVGYMAEMKPLSPDGDMGILVLAPDNVLLNEVTVTGQRPLHRISRGGVITTVNGSVLALLGNAMDVIEQLPGVRREDDKIAVFGKGTPAIYVNGRKLTDYSELFRLSSKEIESVEVINSPGTKYGAEVKSVLLVRTVKKRGDGWSGSAQAVVRAAHSWSQSDNLSLDYRKGSLDAFGSLAFDHARRYQQQRNLTSIDAGSGLYSLSSDITILPVSTSCVANCGLNWQIDRRNVLGVKYEFQGTPYSRSDWTTHEQVTLDGEPLDEIDYHTRWKRKNMPLDMLNMYYIGEFSHWTLTLNNDYYSSRNRARQEISESSLSDGESVVSSLNRIRSTMFASKAVLEYTFGKNSVEGGYEYTHTDRTDRYYNYGDFLPDADDNIREQNMAGFVSATFPIGVYEISGGVRYEHTLSDYYQSGQLVPEQSRRYGRLFPNVDFTFPLGQAKFTLSYTAKTRRPLYSQLSSNIQYDDRFTYETGNPLLQPEMNHDITLAGIYRWIFFSASYQYVRDAIVGIVEPYEEGKPANLMTYLNYDHLSKYSATLSFSPKISRWSPRLRLNLMGQGLKIPAMGEERRMDNPLMFVSLYNSLSLGKGLVATGDITYHTSGDMDVVTLKPSWQVNLGAAKTLGGWYFQLSATDLFRTARNSMITYGSQMRLDKWNYSDSQAVRLTVRYAFNTTMSKYRGRGAGQAEKSRL